MTTLTRCKMIEALAADDIDSTIRAYKPDHNPPTETRPT